MIQKKLIISVATALLVLIGCGKSETSSTGQSTQPTTTSASVQQKTQPSQAPDIRVKGLYVGQDIHDVGQVLSNMIKAQGLNDMVVSDLITEGNQSCLYLISQNENNKLKQFVQDVTVNHKNGDVCDSSIPEQSIIVITDDQGKKVNSIVFTGEDIFGVNGLSLQEFAQQFINAYQIPELKPTPDGLSYVSPEGIKVLMENGPYGPIVFIIKVADHNDVSKGFN